MSLDSPAVPPDRRDGGDAVPVENRALDDTVPQGESPSPFVRRVWKVAAIGALVTASFLVLCYAPEAALLVFAAVWFGSALVQCAKGLGRYTSMGPRWNLAVVVIVLLTVLFGTLLAAGWRISGRVNDLMTNLSGARETIELRLQEGLDSAAGGPVTNPAGGEAASGGEGGDTSGGESGGATGGESRGEREAASGDGPDGGAPEGTAADALMDAIPDPMQIVGGLMGGGRGGASATQRVFTAPFTFGVYALFIFFAGLFLAISPALYREGVVNLFPDRQKEKLREVMDRCAESLWAWTKARLAAMAITGTLTGLALWALGIPMALTLGALTALLVFVPNIGSLIAAVPPVLIAFQQGGLTPLWVLLAYIAVQMLESYIITPYVIGEGTGVPPALVITAQLVFGILFGALGVLFATPLVLVAMILVTRYWIHGGLGDRSVEAPGAD